MKDLLEQLNQVFENRIRLAIMSVLIVNDAIDFNALKQTLDLTDGNLASHVAVLEKTRYITVRKTFVGKKPNTTYAVTASGRKAFTEHVDALEQLIKKTS